MRSYMYVRKLETRGRERGGDKSEEELAVKRE